MPKNKWTILPFIVISTVIIIFIYFVFIHRNIIPAEPLKAIPTDAAIILKINDFEGLAEASSVRSKIWKELKLIPEFQKIDKQLLFLDSMYKHVPEAKQLLQSTPFFISVHHTGRDKVSLMHVVQIPQGLNGKKLHDIIARLVLNLGTLNERKYEGVTVYDVTLLHENELHNFSFASAHNLFIFSFSSLLIEDAIRQLSTGESVSEQKGFHEIYKTAGKNVDANVFVNFQQIPRVFADILKPDYKSEVSSFNSFGDWAEFDVNLLSDMILLNGFVHTPDSIPSIASILVNQSPQRITVDEVLPASISAFLSISFSDINLYFKDYENYLRNKGIYTNYKNLIKSLNNTYDTDFQREFADILDNEITLAFDGSNPEEVAPATYVVMRVKSKSLAEDRLTALISNIALKESKSLQDFEYTYKLDNELSFKIFQMPIRRLTGKIFGELFSSLDEHYFVILDNYLIFSSSVESLGYFIHDQVLNKTLVTDVTYQDYRNNFQPRCNMCFYCNLNKGNQAFSRYLSNSFINEWGKYNDIFQKVPVLGFQVYSSNKMLYANLLINYSSAYNNEPKTVWESRLDTLMNFKPIFVVNHNSRENEVFVQDMKNNIYLINQAGRILWKVQLTEPINSEVFQIDYYKNGKLQLAFSTKNYLHIVDRNGNEVEKYPIKLRSSATCGLSVFDYENNHDYRLFIACEDHKVYAYSVDGTLIKGWAFDKTESEVRQPVCHFKVGDKDYLVFGDLLKTYILDRKGNTRVNVTTYFPKSASNNYILDIPRKLSDARLVTTDTAGKVYFIYFTGKVYTLDLGKFSSEHYFDYKDINGDGTPDYIYLDHNNLSVINNNKEKLIDINFDEAITARPAYYQFSASDRKLGLIARDANKIYMINNNGKTYPGFPLQGNTPFSIANFGDTLSKFNLVVGSKDNFLYNYRVK